MSEIKKPPKTSDRTLVLNADYRPLTVFPLSTLNWQETVKATFTDRVDVVAEYDEIVVRSKEFEMNLPSVIAMREYVKPRKRVPFTRFNLYLRDNFTCQYCGEKKDGKSLTFDHVVPRMVGGKTNWFNIVAACSSCNTKKGSKLLKECGMKLVRDPFEPDPFYMDKMGLNYPPDYLHKSWMDYLYWDTILEN